MKKAFLFLTVLSLMLTFVFSSCGAFEEKYTVTFDCNGGTLDTESSVTVAPNSTVVLPLPHKDDCTFIGWYLGEGANEEKFGAKDTVTSDITLKAKWINDGDITNGGIKIDIHTVTFNADGGSFEGNETINAQTYSTIRLPSPEKEGYVFRGWVIGEGANEAPFTAASLVTDDITLTAKWAKADYTVSFIDYYGNVIKRDTVKFEEAAEAPVVPRVPEACLRFDAWDCDFSSVTADIEVKALYVLDSYTVTYVTGTEQSIPTVSYLFEDVPAAPPTPELSGHYFIGWYLDEEFTEEYAFGTPLTSDITLYAYFNESIPITTMDELLAIEQNTKKSYFLKNDIDCEGKVFSSSIIGFAGTLDGEGHKIHNFVYHPTSAATTGLFATNGGTVKNISFDDFSYSLTSQNIDANIGFIVGSNAGTIENVHIFNASFSFIGKRYLGGKTYVYYGVIAGENNGTITNCSAIDCSLYFKSVATGRAYDGTAYSHFHCASLVGTNNGNIENSEVNAVTNIDNTAASTSIYDAAAKTELGFGALVSLNNGTITECNTTIEVSVTGCDESEGKNVSTRTIEAYIGGFIFINTGNVENCAANANISFNGTFSYVSAAGFVQRNQKTVQNCYADADISNAGSDSTLGGFVARNYGGIGDCYAIGNITAKDATSGKGGFAGYNNGTVNSCFASVDISATNATAYGPFVGVTDTASLITNCYYKDNARFTTNGAPQTFSVTYAEAITNLSLTDPEFLKETLGWSEELWCFDEGKINYPILK